MEKEKAQHEHDYDGSRLDRLWKIVRELYALGQVDLGEQVHDILKIHLRKYYERLNEHP